MSGRGYVGYIRKALEKGFSGMHGSWGGRWPPKKVIRGPTSSSQRFLARLRDFQLASQGPYWAIFFRVSAQNPSKRLEQGQTKARNGFSTLKIGGYHVDLVGWPALGLVGCRLGRLRVG